ncbi:hypothetical protein EJ04DRAFT_576800 [Polyplosphaeria fusca]|uniref:Uncharacterized protein n=1 Tax=Polyplosphaeria fusca TaxID=682080 RepID=A0A9P4R126_9PLEO|nr:hypothetical protein EJ04DRAFT_576800 [Polyplosphaeria fusca]
MGWWCRDPSRWFRSALHRYSRHGLRDDTALRSRCFSKSQQDSAQHRDDEGRPDGLSDLEWMQLQHYRRWKRMLQQDPYKALFGASHAMLNGKGLKEWQWVHRSFPKWMIRELEIPDWYTVSRTREGEKADTKPVEPDADNEKSQPATDQDNSKPVTDHNNPKPAQSKGPSPYSASLRWAQIYQRRQMNTPFEREDGRWAGTASPSDSRRPPEHRSQPVDSKTGASTPIKEGSAVVTPERDPSTSNSLTKGEASSRESTFIKEFLADSPKLIANTEDKRNDWRRTALARRASSGIVPKSRRPQPQIVNVEETPDIVPRVCEPASQPTNSSPENRFWPAMSNRGTSPLKMTSPVPSFHSSGDIEQPSASERGISDTSTAPAPTPTTHHVQNSQHKSSNFESLEQVDKVSRGQLQDHSSAETKISSSNPSRTSAGSFSRRTGDDLDFLTAEDVRASMGSKRSTIESNEEKQKSRAQLEESFKVHQQQDAALSPVLGSKIINDQHVRRMERELKERQETRRELKEDVQPHEDYPHPAPLETSLDRMTKWIQAVPDVFNRNFWQEPVQTSDLERAKAALSSDSLLKGIVNGVQKSRNAMEDAREELVTELPCSKPLVERLKKNEIDILPLTGKVFRSQQDPLILSNILLARNPRERVRQLRSAMSKTEEEFEEACRALIEKDSKSRAFYPNDDRLKKAYEILQKNLTLSRRMLFGLQARLESIGGTNPMQPLYLNIGHRLLTLRDTQLALVRLIERAMQTFGVSLETGLKELGSHLRELEHELQAESSETSAREAAAAQKLQDEVQAQKFAMRGLSDDGYSKTQESTKKSVFRELSPLAHSLFRPFGPQIEKLGKEEKENSAFLGKEKLAKEQVEEDRKLVKEVKKAYEDVYGPITVDHRQVEEVSVADDIAPQILQRDMQKVTGNLDDLLGNRATASTDGQIQPQNPPPTPPPSESEEAFHTTPYNAAVLGSASEATSADSASDPSSRDAPETQHPSSAAPTSFPSPPVSLGSEEPSITAKTDSVPVRQHPSPLKTPIQFKVFSYNANTDEVSIYKTESHTSPDSSAFIPLPEALQHLSHPSKFLPHLPSGFDVVGMQRDLLILRESPEPSNEIREVKVVSEKELKDEEWKQTNPVDGTTRLSPTGYVGVDDLREEVERELQMQWRKEEAKRQKDREEREPIDQRSERKPRKEKRGGGFASVLKTGILAAAGCYIVGVIGEISH